MSGPTWKAITWRGEPDGRAHRFTATLPDEFRDRYRVTGWLRFVSQRPPRIEVVAVTATDTESGATARLHGDRITLSLDKSATKADIERLWRDAHDIVVTVRRQFGPSVIATRAEVERVRDDLAARGMYSGYRSIAKEGGWSRATVIRRLQAN